MASVSQGAVPLVDVWRGDMLESQHSGHAVIVDEAGQIVQAWGNPAAMIYPRSSCKMLQALPLMESGAGAGLRVDQIALACASHSGEARHVDTVRAWLSDLGLSEPDLRCGAHRPYSQDATDALVCSGDSACQLHNNCSGKHAGFLTMNRHLRGDAEYTEADHPLQTAIKQAFEEVTGEATPGYGIDGCSAPNFATSVLGLARAMARYASATEADARGRAMIALRNAMMAHPEMVAGEGRSCTELMRTMGTKAALKTGADGVFIAIIPGQKLGVALKITDGATRASEAALVGLLAHLGVLDAQDPMALKRLNGPQTNARGKVWGSLRLAPGFLT